MKVLIADDDQQVTRLLQVHLKRWEYDVIAAKDGDEAWAELQKEDAPQLALLDWMMPNMDGLQVLRNVRHSFPDKPIYIIILTAKTDQKDIIEGLQAGADDFLSKPFDLDELKARIKAGERIVNFQSHQATRVSQLNDALLRVKKIEGLQSICAYCKKVHAEKKNWVSVESFVSKHIPTTFSHTICPVCYDKHVEPELKKLRDDK